MKKIILLIFGIILIGTSGCNNLSPRLEEHIDNQNGKIDEIRSVQNGKRVLQLKTKKML